MDESFWGLSIQHGKKFFFIGIEMEMTNDGKLNIGMQEYTKEAIDMFDNDVSTSVASTEHGNLNKIK